MNYNQLTGQERYQIYIMKKAGHSQKAIASLLNRHPSTISRELHRNAGLRGYRPRQAQSKASRRPLVEHKTLYTVMRRLTGKRAYLLEMAAIQQMKPWKAKVKTITFDNGMEFTHPYSSWERGSNKNTDGLIR